VSGTTIQQMRRAVGACKALRSRMGRDSYGTVAFHDGESEALDALIAAAEELTRHRRSRRQAHDRIDNDDGVRAVDHGVIDGRQVLSIFYVDEEDRVIHIGLQAPAGAHLESAEPACQATPFQAILAAIVDGWDICAHECEDRDTMHYAPFRREQLKLKAGRIP
jgi:hypothetical protein